MSKETLKKLLDKIRNKMIIKNIVFLLLLLLFGCGSSINVSFKTAATSEGSNNSEAEELIPAMFSFGEPSLTYLNSAQTLSLDLTRLSGNEGFVLDDFSLVTTGTANCQGISATDVSSNPNLSITDCSGDGRVYFKYKENQSLGVIVSHSISSMITHVDGTALGLVC